MNDEIGSQKFHIFFQFFLKYKMKLDTFIVEFEKNVRLK